MGRLPLRLQNAHAVFRYANHFGPCGVLTVNLAILIAMAVVEAWLFHGVPGVLPTHANAIPVRLEGARS
jgi:hypothetical protein